MISPQTSGYDIIEKRKIQSFKKPSPLLEKPNDFM